MHPITLEEAEGDLIDAYATGSPERIAIAEALVDRLDVHPPPVSTLQAALWYAEQGLKVFALQAGSKIPHKGTRGCHDATSDPDTIRAWWERWPDSNVAIATGHLIDVVDIDGALGVQSWLTVEDGPAVLGRVSTPRPGGTHLYVACVDGRSNKAGLLPGVDIRATGGYVCAPPSTNEQGAYYWRTPLDLGALAAVSAA